MRFKAGSLLPLMHGTYLRDCAAGFGGGRHGELNTTFITRAFLMLLSTFLLPTMGFFRAHLRIQLETHLSQAAEP
jgi:hypothetical protein